MVAPWFVVGGSGFIGTNLAKRRECDTFDLVNDPYQDALIYGALVEAMAGHDSVVHLAANADIAAGAENPDLDLDGITITRHVCQAAVETGVKRIVYLSGSGVYGNRSWWPTEDTACYPTSSYGASKVASEALLHAFEQYGIEVTILRPGNVVGPDQTHGVGFDFMAKLRDDPTRLQILGSGKQSKQYLHVEDLLDAIELSRPGTWNVAPDDALTVLEIAELAVYRLGLQEVEFDVAGGLAWPGDIPVVRLDCHRLKALGWSARPSGRAMIEALAVL